MKDLQTQLFEMHAEETVAHMVDDCIEEDEVGEVAVIACMVSILQDRRNLYLKIFFQLVKEYLKSFLLHRFTMYSHLFPLLSKGHF